MFSRKKIKNKPILNGHFFLILFFVLLVVVPVLLKPRVAEAQFTDPTGWPRTIYDSIKESVTSAKDRLWEVTKSQLKVASDITFKNSLRSFFSQMAGDTAVWLSSAGAGQKPLFITKSSYWMDLANATAGDTIATLGEKVFGQEISEPNLSAKMFITSTLNKAYNPTTWCQDNCDAGYQALVEDIERIYHGDVKFTEDTEDFYTILGLLTYFDKYSDEINFPFFKSLYPDPPNTFLCPIYCPDPEAEAPPGEICANPRRANSISEATSLEVSLDNVIGCRFSLINSWTRENQEAKDKRLICLKNCKEGEPDKRTLASDIFLNIKNMDNQNELDKLADIYLQPEENEIGQMLITYGLVQEKTKEETEKEKVIQEGDQLGPIVSKITKEILSPKEAVKSRLEGLFNRATEGETTYTGSLQADLVSFLTQSLVGKVFDSFFAGKCALNPNAEGCSVPTGGSKLSQIVFGSGGPSGIAAAKLYFASISKINFSRGSPGQNEVGSSDLASKGIISSSLQTAIDQQMTVGEAINKGLIGGTFGFDSEGREPAIDSGIPYRTIVYLRNYRVVPVGWELAAKWIQENPQNVTLEKLAFEEFEKCQPGGQSACTDDNSECTGNSDCRDYTLCPNGNECSSNQTCVTESDGGPAACYFSCNTDAECEASLGVIASCIIPSSATLGYCVGDDQPYCQYESSSSPFCGLIDPNWVLKMPATYCEKMGASEELINKEYVCSEDTNQDGKINCNGEGDDYDIGEWIITRNSETCVDEVACLIEDSEGRCLKYGYCFEERPSWKFDGDECSRQYVSCQSMERSDGQEVSYLLNTVDYDGCDVTNAGCRWYCQEPSFDTSTNTWTCTTADSDDKIHFDRDVSECAQSEVGCQEFIRYGEGVNMVQNSSFEYYTGEVDDSEHDAWTQVWIGDGTPTYDCGATGQATSDAYAGAVAVKLEALSNDCSAGDTGRYLAFNNIDTGHSVLNRTFTISFYAKASNACAMSTTVKNGIPGAWATESIRGGPFNLAIDWQRYSYTVTFGENNIGYSGGIPVNPDEIVAMFIANPDCTIYLDAVQVEEGGLTNYKDYGSTNLVYLNQTRTSCPTNDVGCEKYTPTKGGTSIPGVVYTNNLCSKDRVGCSAFQEMPINNIPQRNGVDPLYFIAGTGTKCSAASVGCEEYTNLEEVASGGEGKEYYQKIKQCVKPEAPNIATYYTWEGSDVSGYQLRAFELKQSNIDGAPCTNLEVAGTATENPACVDAADTIASCSASEMAYNPDCTEYYDTAANVYYRLRSRVIEATENCRSYRNTIDSQLGLGDDRIYYLDGTKSIKCSASQAGCREYKGNTGEVTRSVFEDDFEDSGAAASNWVSGILSNESLRANEHSLRVLVNSNGTFSTGTSTVTPNVLSGKLMQGQEYYLTFWLKPESATELTNLVIQNNIYICEAGDNAGELCNDDNDCPNSTCVGRESDALGFFSGSIALTQDWNQYRFGPLRFNRAPLEYEQLAIQADGSFFLDNVLLEEVADTTYLIKGTYVSCGAGDLGCAEYKDSKGQIHYIKSFDHLCAEQYIGCEAMANTQNSKNPFEQTIKEVEIPSDTVETIVYDPAKTCPKTAKGCQKFGLPKLNILNEPEEWTTVYLINDPDKYSYSDGERDTSIICLAENDGCDEYTHTSGGGVSWFKDPRSKTCEFKIISGEYKWYKSGTGLLCPITTPPIEGQPTGKACVKVCESGDYDGQACVYDSDCCAFGTICNAGACGGVSSDVGTACTSDGDCQPGNMCDYWVGLCPHEQSGCNEYRDPSDPENCRATCSLEEAGGEPVPMDDNCNPTVCDGGAYQGEYCYSASDCPESTCSGSGLPGCRSYYYIRDTVEDNRAECGNMVNFDEGCLPFNDTSKSELNMRGL